MNVVVTGSTITNIFSVVGVVGTSNGRPPLTLLMAANAFSDTVLRFEGVLPRRSNVTVVGNDFQTRITIAVQARAICLFAARTGPIAFVIVESTLRIDHNSFFVDNVAADTYAVHIDVFVRDGSFYSHSNNTAYSRTRSLGAAGYRMEVQGNNHSLISIDGNNITSRAAYTWHALGAYGIIANRTQLYQRYNRMYPIVDGLAVNTMRGAAGVTVVLTASEYSLVVCEGSTYSMDYNSGSGNCYSVGIVLLATLTSGSVLKILGNDVGAVAWSTNASVVAIGGYLSCLPNSASRIEVAGGARVEISGNLLRTNQNDPCIDITNMTIGADSSVAVRDNTAERHVGTTGTDLVAKNVLLQTAALTRDPLGRLIVCRNRWYGTLVQGLPNTSVVPAAAEVWPGCDTRTYSPPVSPTHSDASTDPTASTPASATKQANQTQTHAASTSASAPHSPSTSHRSLTLSASHSSLITPPYPRTATVIPPLLCADQLATASIALKNDKNPPVTAVSLVFLTPSLSAADVAHLSLGHGPAAVLFAARPAPLS